MEDIAWGTDAELTDEQFYNRDNDISIIKSLLETTSKGFTKSYDRWNERCRKDGST